MTKIRQGLSNSIERDFGNVTVAQLLGDRSIMGLLNAPESVVAVSDGEQLHGSDLVEDYETITLQKTASSKAA